MHVPRAYSFADRSETPTDLEEVRTIPSRGGARGHRPPAGGVRKQKEPENSPGMMVLGALLILVRSAFVFVWLALQLRWAAIACLNCAWIRVF